MNFEEYNLVVPDGCNVILGQSHFIKTTEDIYEAIVNTNGNAKFGVAFSEASGSCLVRFDGNDETLQKLATDTLMEIGCGHTFVIYLKNAFPINFLGAIKAVPEVCNIFCATANPVRVIIARTELGGGIMGVVDGAAPVGIETEKEVAARKKFLRDIGYKR